MKIVKSVFIVLCSIVFLAMILSTVAHSEEPIHPGYPFVFDMTGSIDRISDTQIVVDDVLCKITSGTTYHSYHSVFADLSSFNIKDQIGVIFVDKEQRIILSVWLIKRAD